MGIRIEYDAYDRTFKLVDSEFGILLEGDPLYDLALPLMVEEDGADDYACREITAMRDLSLGSQN